MLHPCIDILIKSFMFKIPVGYIFIFGKIFRTTWVILLHWILHRTIWFFWILHCTIWCLFIRNSKKAKVYLFCKNWTVQCWSEVSIGEFFLDIKTKNNKRRRKKVSILIVNDEQCGHLNFVFFQKCNLQIHNKFSKRKGVAIPSGPLSKEGAQGLVLAHGKILKIIAPHT